MIQELKYNFKSFNITEIVISEDVERENEAEEIFEERLAESISKIMKIYKIKKPHLKKLRESQVG